MTSSITPPEACWTSAFVILTVTALLVVNVVLVHRSGRTKGGRFIRSLLRHVMRHRARSRSASLASTSTSSPLPLGAEQPNHQQHQHNEQKPHDHNQQQQQQQQQQLTLDADGRDSLSHLSDDEWRRAAACWVQWDPNSRTKAVVQSWIDSNDKDSVERLLMGKRLAFGTSGLRGVMGPGYCRMNDLVVIQTTQGLCRYLEDEGGEEFKKRGVVIGRDHRKQEGVSSEGFALLAAAVFASQGFRVYFLGCATGNTVATPLVAFGVSHLTACAGVMVTASHNPKMDNGYKVYWGNGSQIIPPRDAGIAASIERNLEPWQAYDPASVTTGPLCSDPIDFVVEAYFKGIGAQLCRRREANAHSGLKVVYSAMHGVGDQWARRAFGCFSLPPFLSVESQREPDPEFPTLAFPNPEEPGALDEAIALAETKGVSLVLANDPDGDRLAAAERQPSGRWHVFSGNEIGVLMGMWQWEEWRRIHPNEDPSKAVMIASTVSSKMLSAAAKVEGFTFEETLPGFKWMAHRGQELKAQGKTILFAYEEAIGFGPGDVVLEKDGLSSAALFAEMFVALRGRDSLDKEAEPEAAAEPVPGDAHIPPENSIEMITPLLPCFRGVSLKPTENGAANGAVVPTAPVPSLSPSCTSAVWVTSPLSSSSTENSAMSSPLRSPLSAIDVAGSCACGSKDEGNGQQCQWQRQQSPPEFSSVLVRRLRDLHARYGEFAERNGYVRCEDTQVESNIFSRLRKGEGGSYPSSFGGHKVTGVRDLAEGHGFDSDSTDGRPTLPLVGGGARFLTFKLGEEGVVATLRTSGTEPKIKWEPLLASRPHTRRLWSVFMSYFVAFIWFYVEMQGKPGVSLESVSSRLAEIAAVFVNEALEPKRWGIKKVALG